MEEAVSCAVCSEVYERGDREPVMLPCGHTFCRMCMTNMGDAIGALACPSCRTAFNMAKPRFLPTNFSLLNLAEECGTSQDGDRGACPSHGEPLNFWCRQCQSLACGRSLVEKHISQGHQIVHHIDFVQEKKMEIKTRANRLSQVFAESKEKTSSNFHMCLRKIIELCHESQSLTDLDAELYKISTDAKHITQVESALVSETKLQSLHHEDAASGLTEAMTMMTMNVAEVDEGITYDSPVKGQKLASLWPLTCCVVSGDGRQGALVQEGGFLLVCALGHHLKEAHVSIQLSMLESMADPMAPTVFLELSARGQYLGRITVRLWLHLRRAQHFKALCLGSLGPSYIGSKFEYVGNKDQAGEYMVGGGYLTQEVCRTSTGDVPVGRRMSRGLMKGLEWGGEYAGEDREGFLQGAGGGHREYDALFCICSRSDPTGKSQCPFGEVVAGMEVVRAAVHHDPIQEVTISQCGLILHNS